MSREQSTGSELAAVIEIRQWGGPLMFSPELLDDWRCGSELSREEMAEVASMGREYVIVDRRYKGKSGVVE